MKDVKRGMACLEQMLGHDDDVARELDYAEVAGRLRCIERSWQGMPQGLKIFCGSFAESLGCSTGVRQVRPADFLRRFEEFVTQYTLVPQNNSSFMRNRLFRSLPALACHVLPPKFAASLVRVWSRNNPE
ncbi:hypothetical protein ACFL26_01955 [Patescibacteria group bacterium]